MATEIGVIGRVADGISLLDGQTVKTRVLVDELRKYYPETKITVVDTYNYKKNCLKIIVGLIKCVIHSQVIFILLSRNGMRVIFPIVNCINKLYNKPIFHDVIGGATDELIAKYPYLKGQFSSVTLNWVESENLVGRLHDMGLTNVEFLPNFKHLDTLDIADIKLNKDIPFLFCTFSRVCEEKGICKAAEAIKKINKKRQDKIVSLDIYGPIEKDFAQKFDEIIRNSKGSVIYKGTVPYDRSVEVLKNYYALLFPTTFYGEGFPGTLIDAMSSGVPIICSNWHLNDEIVKHGYTGFIYDWRKDEELIHWMEVAIDNPALIYEMKKNCLCEVRKYSPEYVMQIINSRIQKYIY